MTVFESVLVRFSRRVRVYRHCMTRWGGSSRSHGASVGGPGSRADPARAAPSIPLDCDVDAVDRTGGRTSMSAEPAPGVDYPCPTCGTQTRDHDVPRGAVVSAWTHMKKVMLAAEYAELRIQRRYHLDNGLGLIGTMRGLRWCLVYDLFVAEFGPGNTVIPHPWRR